MDRCSECGFQWGTPLLDEIRLVSRFPDEVHEITWGKDAAVYARPAPDVWSPGEYVWHLADVFGIFAEWIHMARTEPHPACRTLDGDTLAAVRGYAGRPLSTGIWALWNAVSIFVQEAVSTDPDCGVTCTGWKDVTVAEIVDLAAHEVVHHTRDIQEGLLRQPAMPSR